MKIEHGADVNLEKPKSQHGTVMAVSMMKDEAPFLLEWFSHHLALGFTDILVYTNDCSDGTDDMLSRLEELGLGYHRRNVIPDGIKPQPSALKHAQSEPLVQNADWVMVFDADEFLCIKHKDGTVDGLLSDAVAQGANGIVITWRVFGSGKIVEWSTEPVTEQYLYAAPPIWNKGWGVKTLFKFDAQYWKLGIHRPKIKSKHLKSGFPDTVKWLNGSGAPMEDYFKFRGWRSIRRTVGYDWVQLNHYALKSIDSYALRKMRGNVNNKSNKYNSDYWALQDRNEVLDDTILRHAQKRNQVMAELLKDPVLRKLHFDALDRVEKRLTEYKTSDSYKELVTDLQEASKIPIGKVEAKPPKPRDPAKIASLMSEVERKSQREPKTKSHTMQSHGPDHGFLPAPVALQNNANIKWFKNHSVLLPADSAVFTSEALTQIVAGKYARKQMRSIHHMVPNNERLLSDGGEGAIVALQAKAACPDATVRILSSREDLLEIARQLAEQNGLTDPNSLSFEATTGQANALATNLGEFKPTVLRLTDPKLQPEDLNRLELETVNKVLLQGEFSFSFSSFTKTLNDLGFRKSEVWAERGLEVFDRHPAVTSSGTTAIRKANLEQNDG